MDGDDKGAIGFLRPGDETGIAGEHFGERLPRLVHRTGIHQQRGLVFAHQGFDCLSPGRVGVGLLADHDGVRARAAGGLDGGVTDGLRSGRARTDDGEGEGDKPGRDGLSQEWVHAGIVHAAFVWWKLMARTPHGPLLLCFL